MIYTKKVAFIQAGFMVAGLGFALTIAGCNSFASQARDSIAAFNGYLTAAQAKHTGECIVSKGELPVCDTLRRSDAAENAAIDALEAYCQIPPHTTFTGAGASCKPVTSLQGGLTAALAGISALTPDIKAAAQ